MNRIFKLGGYAAGVLLIAIGIGAIWMGADAYNQVRDSLAQEKIVGTPDSKISGDKVDTGDEARIFADVMRKHTLEATEGQTYAEMGRFLDEEGEPTSDEEQAATDDKSGQPVENPLRQMWVTETALSTALNMSYLAERLAVFGIVVGFAILLAGIGFIVITMGAVGSAAPAKKTAGTQA